jgi:class 3 adenylate cyclase/HAMP domain-containing protein
MSSPGSRRPLRRRAASPPRLADREGDLPRGGAKPERIGWLPPIVLLVNLAVLAVLVAYSSLNLRPYVPRATASGLHGYHQSTLTLTLLLPTIATVVYVWPILLWLRRVWRRRGPEAPEVPAAIVGRAANAPVALAGISLASWLVTAIIIVVRLHASLEQVTAGLWVHFIARPLLAGLVAAVAVFFAAEYVCRTSPWPTLLAATRIEGNRRLWKIRVTHRFLLLWLAISFLPLGAVGLTAVIRVDRLDVARDPALGRVMAVILLIAGSAALGGAALAWLLAQSMGRPLRALEQAMARVREGDFSVRESVSAPDEIGGLTEGFNLMAERLSASYKALETRNRELAQALDRVAFLESVKRGLDRFVPDTVRRAIEENPEAPALRKISKDVTVLFLDIEGYTHLSEQLSREALTDLIERYFSLFLAAIRREGGDINETAGDGLMILFQAGAPAEHAAAAVHTALAIRDLTAAANRDTGGLHPPISVNIGISSGECHVGSTRLHGIAGERWTFTATGPVTNLAARLGDRAVRGQILLSRETARRVESRFRLHGLGLLSLKNIAKPVEAWEVAGTTAEPAGPAATVEAERDED